MKNAIITLFTSLTLMISTRCVAFSYTQWGDVAQFIPTGVLAILNVYNQDRSALLTQTYSYASSLSTVGILKYSIHTMRPNGGQHSFPSGHTASAFMGVYPIYKRYGWKVGLPALLVASSVAHSRVQGDYHYTRDVIASALISLSFDYFYFRNKFTNTIVSLSPSYISVSYSY